MALGPHEVAFLATASQQGVDFDRTLMIGRQQSFGSARQLGGALREAGMHVDPGDVTEMVEQRYAEPVFHSLGGRVVDSLDASEYEGATLVHDLNRPVPAELRAKYSVVIDSGSLEHVFNFPVGLAGCLESVALGGHYLAITPMNSWAGHGFYQFSPELYFRVLSEQNGFTVRCMLARTQSLGRLGRWYRVADPATVGRRIHWFGLGRALLYIVARRTELRDVLDEYPQQSDYTPMWEANQRKAVTPEPAGSQQTAGRRISQQLPPGVRRAWGRMRWGGLQPMNVERARGLARAVRTHRQDLRPVALRDLTFS